MRSSITISPLGTYSRASQCSWCFGTLSSVPNAGSRADARVFHHERDRGRNPPALSGMYLAGGSQSTTTCSIWASNSRNTIGKNEDVQYPLRCYSIVQNRYSGWLLVIASNSRDHISEGSSHFRNQECVPRRKSFESFTGLANPSLPILRIELCVHRHSLKL